MSRYIQQENRPKPQEKKEPAPKPKPGAYTSKELGNLGGKVGNIQWTK